MSHLITEPGTPAAPPPPPHDHGGRGRLVEVVVPVHNEERVLSASVERLHAYLADTLPYPFRITVADNASTDATWPIARDLAARHPRVRAVRLRDKGRGRALRHVWGTSDADVVAYMDVDLSTDLDAFLPLVAPLISGHSDLAIGSRLTRGSAVVRGPRREIISRCYNLLLRTALAARFTDAQCGFKAARTEIVQALLPSVEDEEWFFDTELLLLAERNGLRIHEVPVDWVDDPDSRVDVLRTARDDLRGMARVARRMLTGAFRAPVGGRPGPAATTGRAAEALPAGMARQLPAFAVIGVLSTLAQLILFVLLRLFLGPLWANALSLVVTTVGNTAANRRFTFGVTGNRRALRQQLEGGAAFLLGLALSTGGLALLHTAAPGAGRAVEVAALVTANALATLVRFLLMRAWIFHPRRLDDHPDQTTAGPAAAPAPASAADRTGGTTA
ncbi:bifunctional glycosyltransferase family 2/GtrA family protein [Actinomadura citrea]|uniref:dolichyl-phosphate beta-glucosyltransferase n=1 Tax=Actinomadura citrea TaxID=46158 RepID=A0A7Y9GF66_9ACTN|nr:bifunctional glycosyltransferase family 2/GtrA family protein [Actinomadura citrea]NYE14165.1 putative flippase GtrA [Actinomadura citrea]GGU02562.1 sugar translocase [Actinomadura citrea]